LKTQLNNKELIVLSSTENLAVIRKFIQSAANQFGISEDDTGKILLSVDEACTNIIRHAYKNNPKGKIKIQLLINKSFDTLKIIIEDNGVHFNPKTIPEPDLTEYLHQKKVGGLGMFLMKKIMDKVSYKTLSDGKNKLLMIKKLS